MTTPIKNEKVAAFIEEYKASFPVFKGRLYSPHMEEVVVNFLKDNLPSLLMEIISDCLPPELTPVNDYYEGYDSFRTSFLQALKDKGL